MSRGGRAAIASIVGAVAVIAGMWQMKRAKRRFELQTVRIYDAGFRDGVEATVQRLHSA